MLTRFVLALGLLAGAMLAPAFAAKTERRVALVVGNSEYAHASALRNPRNDANDLAELLKKLDFEVLLSVDLDQQKFARSIDQFGRMLEDAEVGLFFYAGHGLQINDKNYLVSTNAQLANEFLIPSETIELDAVVRLMESKTATNLIFLDACRNNPLAEDLRKNLAALKRNVGLGRGLARVDPTGRDTLIAFAAAPGQEAADGSERNSPFTAALLRHLPKAGLEVSVMLKQVAADVRRETQNTQRPQQLSDRTKMFFFANVEAAAASKVEPVAAAEPAAKFSPPQAALDTDNRALEVAYWNAAQSANECDAVRAYLKRFPSGVFVELAKLSERRLCSVAGRRIEVLEGPAGPPAPTATASPTMQPASTASNRPQASAALTAPAANAALQSSAPIAGSPEPAATKLAAVEPTKPAAELAADTARYAQRELRRLGCGSAETDGKWGQSSKAAVRLFNKHAKAKLDPEQASAAMLAALREREKRVCPLQCEAGFRVRGDTCVAVKAPPARSSARAERPVETRRPARVVREQPAPAPKQPTAAVDPAVPAGLMLLYGAGRLRVR